MQHKGFAPLLTTKLSHTKISHIYLIKTSPKPNSTVTSEPVCPALYLAGRNLLTAPLLQNGNSITTAALSFSIQIINTQFINCGSIFCSKSLAMDATDRQTGAESPKSMVLEQAPRLQINGASALMDAVEDVLFGSVSVFIVTYTVSFVRCSRADSMQDCRHRRKIHRVPIRHR